MADDIVERLRTTPLYDGFNESSGLPDEAADFIERQNTRIAELEADVAALKNPWRPVDEAPRDGELVLFMTRNGACHIAPSVHDRTKDELRRLHKQLYEQTGEWPSAGWMSEWWMPLPPAPNRED